MTMLASIMGVWIIASIISSSPGVQTGADDKNLGRLAKFSSEEATFNDNACKNPKYSLHPKDHAQVNSALDFDAGVMASVPH